MKISAHTILSFFLPETVGTYRLLTQKTVGIIIEKTGIQVSVARAYGTKVILEQSFTQTIAPGIVADYQERIEQALLQVKEKVGHYDRLISAIPASVAFIKEITLPFTTREKIALVIQHEIAALFPVSVEDIVFDFVINRVNTEQNSAQVLVIAAQKQYIAENLAVCEAVGMPPDSITIDALALYPLARLNTQEPSTTHVILDVGFTTTRILSAQDKSIAAIRSIPVGISTIAKGLSTRLHVKPSEALDMLIRFGMNAPKQEEAYTTAITAEVADMCLAIERTLPNRLTPTTHITILDSTTMVAHMDSAIGTALGAPCTVLTTATLTSSANYRVAEQVRESHTVLSVGLVLPVALEYEINLRKKEFKKQHMGIFIAQISIALCLIIGLFATLMVHHYRQVAILHGSLNAQRQATISHLKDTLRMDDTFKRVDDVLETARLLVEKQESTWFAFSDQTRSSFLKYLEGLSTAIDREALGLKLKKLLLTKDSITLQGQVKGWDVGGAQALDTLEASLRATDFFVDVPRFQDTVFTERLLLKKQNGQLE